MRHAIRIDRRTRDRGPVVEAFVVLDLRIVGEEVDLAVRRDVIGRVQQQLVPVAGRVAPDLHRIRRVRQLAGQCRVGRRELDRHRTLCAAAGLFIVVIFAADVDETLFAESEAEVGRNLLAGAVAVVKILTVACDDFHARGVVAQAVVQHAGDGVGAVLGGRAVTQNLQALEADAWDGRDVGALRSEGQGGVAAAIDLNQGGAVVALAVQHHEDFIAGQAAQRRRAHEGRCVGDRILADIERRDDALEGIEQVRSRLGLQLGAADHVDGRCGIFQRAVRPACAENDHFLHRVGGGLVRGCGCSAHRTCCHSCRKADARK